MPEDYQEKLSNGVVSFKVTISKTDAKHKLGQQRKKDDQVGVLSALQSSANLESVALANYMGKFNVGVGMDED